MSTKINLAKSERLRKLAWAALIWTWEEQDRLESKDGKLVQLKIEFRPLGYFVLRSTRFRPEKGFAEHAAQTTVKWCKLQSIFREFHLFSDTDLYKQYVSLSHDPTPEEIEKARVLLKLQMGGNFVPYEFTRYRFAFQSAPVIAVGHLEEEFGSEKEAMDYLNGGFLNSRAAKYIIWDLPDDKEIAKTAHIVSVEKK